MTFVAASGKTSASCGSRSPHARRYVRTAEIIDFGATRHRHGAKVSCPPSVRGTVARIYRPARSAVQAGRANTKLWVLELEPATAPEIEPLMGWTSSSDTEQQVRLTFPSREQAVAFAERRGWAYTVSQPREPKIKLKSYADNFRWRPTMRKHAAW